MVAALENPQMETTSGPDSGGEHTSSPPSRPAQQQKRRNRAEGESEKSVLGAGTQVRPAQGECVVGGWGRQTDRTNQELQNRGGRVQQGLQPIVS